MRKVLTCLQTKNLKRLLIVTTTHSMSNKLSCRQPATRCCVTIITKLKCDTLVWKKYPKKHLKRDGQIRTAFFFCYAVVTNTNISALELCLEDLENRSSWFASNYLSVNAKKTQAMILVSTPMNLLFILATLLSE